jgi:hypothetical protein
MLSCCARPLPLPPAPVAQAAANPGPGFRLRESGVQRLSPPAGGMPRGRGEYPRQRDSAPGDHVSQGHPGTGMAGGGTVSCVGAGMQRCPPRVAVLHRKVRESRLDHAHKTALRLVRDNQAVYAEDLAVSGLARTRLVKSVHYVGWAQLLRLLAEKAEHYGRTFHRIGRFVPTSQVCSDCGVKDGPKPLSVRQWSCAACGAVHDRDINAARNILAAGRAERRNACGGARKTTACGGGCRRSRNPPEPGMSRAGGTLAVRPGWTSR